MDLRLEISTEEHGAKRLMPGSDDGVFFLKIRTYFGTLALKLNIKILTY